MDQQRFNIVFRGDIGQGAQLGEVKQNLARLFKSTVEKMERLFVGRPVAIKKGLTEVEAQRYQKALLKAGALTQLVNAETGEVKVAEPKVKTESLAERIARIEAEQQAEQHQPPVEPEPYTSEEIKSLLDTVEDDPVERGEDIVLTEAAHEPQRAMSHNTNHAEAVLSLRPMEGNLLDDFEKVYLEPVSVDVAGISLAEPGGDLLRPEEKKPEVAEPNLKIDFDLAPAGSILSEYEREQDNSIPPDLASISIED